MATTERTTQTVQLLTAEQFFAPPDVTNSRFELIAGEVVAVGGTGHRHIVLVITLFQLLDAFAKQHGLGKAYPDGFSYIIARNPDTVRIPDVSFIAKEHALAGSDPHFAPFAPDLAVEIVSPNDSAIALWDKMHQYLDAGTRLVWIVWPDRQSVAVFPAVGVHRELRGDDELDGGDVLPGFRVRVAELFAETL